MATDQDSIKVYLPREDAEAFRKLANHAGQTIAGRIRVLIRKDLQTSEAGASSPEAAPASPTKGV